MATFSSVTRSHVLQAIGEYDERGADDFLAVHGFAPGDHTVLHEGRRYDASALLGVAHRHATGRLATTQEFTTDLPTAVTVLRRRGFEVVEPTRPVPARPPRSTSRSSSPRTRVAGSGTRTTSSRTTTEAPPAICPTCSMTLPATRICDDCG
jgi:hypothetical protein